MRKTTFIQAINEALREEMQRDERVFLIGEDIGHYGGLFRVTRNLLDEFGERRVIDTPISEQGFMGMAVGAAMVGLRPIVELMYMDFYLVCADQIFNQAAKMHYMTGGLLNVPMVIRGQQGGGKGYGSQHSSSVESTFAQFPGIKVVAPSTPYDAKGLLKAAIRDDNPVLFFEHKLLYGSKGARSEKGAVSPKGEVPDEEYIVPIGEATVRRAGKDVTIVASLLMLYRALEAAEVLAQEGIEAEVIDPRTLVPFDKERVLHSVKKTGRLVIVEEDNLTNGWGAEVAAWMADEAFVWLDAPIKRVAAPDVPPPFAPILEQHYVPSTARVVDTVRSLFGVY